MKKAMIAAALMVSAIAPAHAATFIVDAKNNSSTGGTGVSTLSLVAGQNITISSSLNDLWNAGALPRYSDANGLVAPRFKTAADDAPFALGTKIGDNFGVHSQGGLTAAYGSLVGRIGSVYKLLGANYSGAAWGTGTLELFYWDSNSGDNTGNIAFNVASVPEPATWAMLLLGFGVVGGAMRRRAKVRVNFA